MTAWFDSFQFGGSSIAAVVATKKRKREPIVPTVRTVRTVVVRSSNRIKKRTTTTDQLIHRIWTAESTAYDRYALAARICDRTGSDVEIRILVAAFDRVLMLWPNRLSEPDDGGDDYPAFRSAVPPSVEPYLIFETVLHLSRSGFSTGILAIMILGSMINAKPPLKLSRWNVHRAILGATVAAYKFDQDVSPSNAPMADCIGRRQLLTLPDGVRTFNDIELQTAFIIRWNIAYADTARADFFAGLAVRPVR